jgi:integrase
LTEKSSTVPQRRLIFKFSRRNRKAGQCDHAVLTDIDGKPLQSNVVSMLWCRFAQRIGMPEVTFHALRHTHASQLIDAGVDIVTISKRLGHAKPDITLRVYAHLFRKDDSKAAAAINALF